MAASTRITDQVRGVAGRAWHRLREPIHTRATIVLAVGVTFLSYLSVFALAGDQWVNAADSALRNTIVLGFVAMPTGLLIDRYVCRIGGIAELIVHLGMAVGFALMWFFALMLAIGLASARSWSDFDVRPVFPNSASTWQLLQGVLIYAVLAALIKARAARRELHAFRRALADRTAGTPPPPQRYFIKRDSDALPVDLDQIVSISGADDYSEVSTLRGKHLVRLTLARFEQSLDPARFCRIHRSCIVNIGHIERFEPDGSGRLLVWMDNGQRVRTSREGARKLKTRLI